MHEALVLDPNYAMPDLWVPDYMLGNYQDALATCENGPQYRVSQDCLAFI